MASSYSIRGIYYPEINLTLYREQSIFLKRSNLIFFVKITNVKMRKCFEKLLVKRWKIMEMN